MPALDRLWCVRVIVGVDMGICVFTGMGMGMGVDVSVGVSGAGLLALY